MLKIVIRKPKPLYYTTNNNATTPHYISWLLLYEINLLSFLQNLTNQYLPVIPTLLLQDHVLLQDTR